MTKTEIAVNLKKLLYKHEISATQLAQLIDIPQPTIHRIIVGKSKQPRTETINKIASYFQIDANSLFSPATDMHHSQIKINQTIDNITEIPVVDHNHPENTTETILSTRNLNPNCFAVRLIDSSMEPLFTKNNIVIFDPNKTALDRHHILVRPYETNLFLFRQLIINGEDKFLKPLNPDLNIFPLKLLEKNDLIYGVAVESRWEIA